MVKCLKNIKSFLKIKVPTKYAKFALQQYYLITKCIEICMFFWQDSNLSLTKYCLVSKFYFLKQNQVNLHLKARIWCGNEIFQSHLIIRCTL